MKKAFSFVVLAVMSLVAVFAATPAQAEEATLTVNVADESGSPVVGAFVGLNNPFMEAETNEAGVAKFTGIDSEAVSGKKVSGYVMSGYSYVEFEADFTTTLNAVANVTITEPSFKFVVTVVTGDYEQVEGALVTLLGREVVTDNKGVAEFPDVKLSDLESPEMPVPFSVYKDGYAYYEGQIWVEGEEPSAMAVLEAEEASLTIKVVTGDYEPVAEATVTFQGKEYTTGENGEAKITGLSAPEVLFQEVEYTVYKDGYDVYTGVAFFEMLEAQAVAQLVPAEASLAVKVVTGEDYEPVADATVTFQGKEYTTGENGEAKITGLSAPEVLFQEIEYTVYKDGYDVYTGVAFFEMLEAQAVAQLVPAEAILKIKVVTGEDYEPVEGATVTVNDQTYYTAANGEVNVTGIKFVDVLGKTLPYTVTKDGYAEFNGEADFTESMEAYSIAQLVAEQSTLTIKVITGEENDPVTDALVSFQDKEYTTDEKGEVKITLSAPDVIGKEFPFTAYKDGYDFFEGTVIFDSFEAWGIATLVPSQATISVKVTTGEENEPVAEATVTVNGRDYLTNANGEVKIIGLYGPDVIGTTVEVVISKEGFETFNAVADFTETLDAQVWVQLVVDEESSIAAVKAAIANSKAYDLQGRTITEPHKGQIYIINGRKVRL